MNTEVRTRQRPPRQPPAGPPWPPPAGQRPPRAAGTAQPGTRQPAAGAARAGLAGLQRPPAATQPGPRPAAGRGLAPAATHVPRTRFILLVLGLLGGGLVCLLVINTTLAAASFRISALQRGNVALAQQAQTLQQQVATEESPSSLRQRALKLGMRTQPLMNFINLRTGHVYRAPAALPGVPNVPGYTP